MLVIITLGGSLFEITIPRHEIVPCLEFLGGVVFNRSSYPQQRREVVTPAKRKAPTPKQHTFLSISKKNAWA